MAKGDYYLNGEQKMVDCSTQTIEGKTFAGKGTKTEIRNRFVLESRYNIPADKWEKVAEKGYVVRNGKNDMPSCIGMQPEERFSS